MAEGPRVFSISGTRPFLKTLARAVLDGEMFPAFRPRENPLILADATILVPNRRAARTLADCFLSECGGQTLILPAIRPVGDIEGEEEFPGEDVVELPLTLPPLNRLLALTRLVQGWTKALAGPVETPSHQPIKVPTSPADAVFLAADLIALIDQAATEEASFGQLATLVPEDYSAWWQLTHAFLRIATEFWPQYVEAEGAIEPMERRARLIDCFGRRLQTNPPKGPIIAAGSTASVPATRRLLQAIAAHEWGAVVLPGLDLALDDESYQSIFPPGADLTGKMGVPSHPQYGLKAFLDGLRLKREDVPFLGGLADSHEKLRDLVIAETFRPAPTTEKWAGLSQRLDAAELGQAFAGHMFLEAAHEGQEALAIAVALREVLETSGRTAALVTPHRPLARRVVAELRRFGVEVEIAAGEALEASHAGVLARLAADVALGGCDPVALSALLGNLLCRLGFQRAEMRHIALALENAVLRGPKLKAGSAAVVAAVEDVAKAQKPRAHLPLGRLGQEDFEAMALLANRLAAALAPLEEMTGGSLADYLAAHRAVCVALMENGAGDLPDDFSAAALDGFFAEALSAGGEDLHLSNADYPHVFRALTGGYSVRGLTPEGVPIRILGPLDARLQRFDLVILGGLDEGLWPPATQTDAWLSRPMRSGLGMEPPERRIGLSAHDASQHILGNEVILTRALKREGAPTVASRWWQRLQTVLGKVQCAEMTARGNRYVALARALDDAPPAPRLARPEPKPPLALRPAGLSITEIETLIRDPYAIYARRILRLEALEEIGALPDFSERGIAIHGALSDFAKSWTGPMGEAAYTALIAAGRQAFRPLEQRPEVHALWWPRFTAMARYVIDTFEAGRGKVTRHAEITGEWAIPVDGEEFRLRGRADRIDVPDFGPATLVDFKTGSAPTLEQIQALRAPQMPLEAAMLKHGYFNDLPAMESEKLVHVVLKGLEGRDKTLTYPGKKNRLVSELADEAVERLKEFVRHFRQEANGYISHWAMERARSSGDYDHLARVAEWSATGEAADDGEGEG